MSDCSGLAIRECVLSFEMKGDLPARRALQAGRLRSNQIVLGSMHQFEVAVVRIDQLRNYRLE
jgi:hypothetical protein